MPRRMFIATLHEGEASLASDTAHHVRDVLRLTVGDELELFDPTGRRADATISALSSAEVRVRVGAITAAPQRAFSFTVASAVPKGNRADWMVEKLSELGASAFVSLAAARSVVLPEGAGKRDRWVRLATESARQSRRAGVMRIEPLTPLARAIESSRAAGEGWFFSLDPGAHPARVLALAPAPAHLTLFIGPEGGWTDAETADLIGAGIAPVALTRTVLRIETAALAAAALVATVFGSDD